MRRRRLAVALPNRQRTLPGQAAEVARRPLGAWLRAYLSVERFWSRACSPTRGRQLAGIRRERR